MPPGMGGPSPAPLPTLPGSPVAGLAEAGTRYGVAAPPNALGAEELASVPEGARGAGAVAAAETKRGGVRVPGPPPGPAPREAAGGYLGPIQPGSQCRHDPVSASQASPCRQRGHGWRQPSPWKPGAQRSLHKVPFQPGWHARQKPSTGEQGWLRLQFPQLHGHRGGEASASSPSPKKMLHPTRAAQTSPSPTYLPIQPKGRMYPVDFPPRSAPSSPVHTLRPVFPRRAGLPAAPALVPGDAAAVPAEGVAGAVQAVAAPLARQPPKPSLALALARLLGAGREVAGALEAAPPAPPARQAVAVPGQGVAVRVGGVALALLLAAGRPPARLAAAGTGQGLAAAVGPALARELAQLAPAIGVAGAAPARRLARPAGVARAPLLAVGAPVLRRATCGGKKK